MGNAASTHELRMSREDYRAWANSMPHGRFERIDGVVVAMAPERAGHARRKARIHRLLEGAILAAGLPCEVFPGGMTVEVDESDYEPDAVLRCGAPLPSDAVAVPDPLVLVEVLSPGTRGSDFTRKLVDYFRVPSVQHYLIVWPDRPHVIHHRRSGEGAIETRTLSEGEIRLDPPGITIAIADLYRA